MSRPRKKSQAQRLTEALRETGLSRRQLARGLLPANASAKDITNKKSQIVRWLKSQHGMSDETARRVAAAFRAAGHHYTDDHFLKGPERPMTLAEELAALRGGQQAQRLEYQKQLRDLRAEIAAGHQEVLEEIRKLREAS